MCGFVGGVDARFDERSLARIAHRGPDQSAFVIERAGDLAIALGQVRLSVVDRHDVVLPQRIARGDRRAVIVYNGEVYNWLELREELAELGWRFETQTDTEVVLAAYLEWGPACLSRFNGMFAFGIWDGERFFCARDRLGKKPLFYRAVDGRFEFASELKAFEGLVFEGNDLFDLFEFCPDEHTLFRGIFSLSPGCSLTYSPSKGTLERRAYWDLPHVVGRRLHDPHEAVDRFIELLTDSVKLRMRADVPITLFLSGGLDSTILAMLGGVKKAFTCQFEEFRSTIDEELYARDFAERAGIELELVRPTREEFFADLPKLAWHIELPTGSFSVFPLYRLALAARQAGFKVALSGEGSDELFGGYVRNELLALPSVSDVDPRARTYRAMLERFEGSPLDRFCRMASRTGLAGAALMKGYLWSSWSEQRTAVDNVAYVETRLFLQALLQMSDRMTMAVGLEARNPFLDYRLVEFAFTLDDSLRIRAGVDPTGAPTITGKWLVRAAAERLLPKGSLALERKVKHGLPTPINEWLRGRPSFDRRTWNAVLTAECMKQLLGPHTPEAP
jgi:asparagine synthase (glutamine-hydrolysing)